MKKLMISALLFSIVTGGAYAQKGTAAHGYPIDPVPFTSVKITDSFWGQRLKASRETTIPLAFSKCEETGRYNLSMIPMYIKPSKEPATCCKPIPTRNWKNTSTVC